MPTLDWVGKDKVVSYYKQMPIHSFIKDEDLSRKMDENLFIEGDNLIALKSLLPKYKGRIKCIYIDPPYNTGKENWVYNDNVNDPRLKEWINKVVGKEAEDLNRHDKWLCMMYPRLLLAHEFLAEDGVIFVSIDDNASQYLKIMMDEIFKRENLLANFVWQSDGNFDNQAKVKICHEYIMAYCKNYNLFPYPKVIDPNTLKNKKSKLHNGEIRNTVVKNGPKNPVSSILLPAGFPCDVEQLHLKSREDAWPHYEEDIVVKDFKLVSSVVAKSGWSSKKILESFINNNFEPVLDTKGQECVFTISKSGAIEGIKARKKEGQSHVLSVLRELGSTQSTSSELKKIGMKFDFPKPTELLEYLLSMVDGKDYTVLDFFSGSGTTAEAVLNLNVRDQGKRKFILIEWNRSSIKDIARERVIRKIEKYIEIQNTKFHYLTIGEPIIDKFKRIKKGSTLERVKDYIHYLEFPTESGRNPISTEDFLVGGDKKTTLYILHPQQELFEMEKLLPLSMEILNSFKEGPKLVYGSYTNIDFKILRDLEVEFKQVPYDL